MEFEGLTTLFRNSGIVGAGGAGFPSYAKLNKEIDTLIVNCAECEPLLRLHRQLMEKKAYEITFTVDLIAQTLGVRRAVIALKSSYKKALQALKENVRNYANIDVLELAEAYPAGDEVVLIYEATKRVVQPGKLPASVGVTVYNVETVFNMYNAIYGSPVTHKFVTVTGEVKNPTTFYAPIGMKFSELVKLAGGETITNPEFLIGGPMMGKLGSESDVVTKTTNAIILLPEDHYVVLRKKISAKIDLKRAMAACCQCHMCTDLCPRHLLGHPIEPSELMRVVSNQDSHDIEPYINSFYCSGCGLCEMFSCHQGLSPRNLIGEVKNSLRKAGVKAPNIDKQCEANPDRELRKVPLKRLRARLDLERYNVSAPIVEEKIETKEVKILLSQHIGAAAIPIVKVGDVVKCGQVIAEAPEGKLSVNIHSSMNGEVIMVTDKYILIHE